ncbi:MAG: hypothetical protein KGI59_03430 [Patescibacteria group bacterium]|nr:hypothetical protein [Patescibacteria group bacterium]MDE2172777.1 hypothetical protein [Patescibacteria group bacterium]
MTIEIIPAILPKDFAEVTEKVELIKGFTKIVQIDICDGQFVQNATWPYRKHDDNFDRILREEEGLPGWEALNYEFDLMVNRPEEIVDEWVRAGAARIILHAEAKGDIAAAIVRLAGVVEIGLALDIESGMEILELHHEKLQFVQCMGIDNVGFQHQAFDDKVVDKVKLIKERYPGLRVSVDGGVSLETAPRLIKAGADRLVVGSAIFGADNPIDALSHFRAL